MCHTTYVPLPKRTKPLHGFPSLDHWKRLTTSPCPAGAESTRSQLEESNIKTSRLRPPCRCSVGSWSLPRSLGIFSCSEGKDGLLLGRSSLPHYPSIVDIPGGIEGSWDFLPASLVLGPGECTRESEKRNMSPFASRLANDCYPLRSMLCGFGRFPILSRATRVLSRVPLNVPKEARHCPLPSYPLRRAQMFCTEHLCAPMQRPRSDTSAPIWSLLWLLVHDGFDLKSGNHGSVACIAGCGVIAACTPGGLGRV